MLIIPFISSPDFFQAWLSSFIYFFTHSLKMAAPVAGFYTPDIHYILCSTVAVHISWFYCCYKYLDECNVNESKNMGEICAIAYCQLPWFRFYKDENECRKGAVCYPL
jgi:hypothetical protein